LLWASGWDHRKNGSVHSKLSFPKTNVLGRVVLGQGPCLEPTEEDGVITSEPFKPPNATIIKARNARTANSY
jgi:hypothetical protein